MKRFARHAGDARVMASTDGYRRLQQLYQRTRQCAPMARRPSIKMACMRARAVAPAPARARSDKWRTAAGPGAFVKGPPPTPARGRRRRELRPAARAARRARPRGRPAAPGCSRVACCPRSWPWRCWARWPATSRSACCCCATRLRRASAGARPAARPRPPPRLQRRRRRPRRRRRRRRPRQLRAARRRSRPSRSRPRAARRPPPVATSPACRATRRARARRPAPLAPAAPQRPGRHHSLSRACDCAAPPFCHHDWSASGSAAPLWRRDSARWAQARPPLDGPVAGGAPAAPAPRAYPGAGASAEAERVLVASVVADGRHHARWPDGSEYFGEWRGGRAHGRGAFVWPSGAAPLSRCRSAACRSWRS